MNVILFGATGMVGQGVLRECLLDSDIERILVVGRTTTGQRHEKLRELIHADFMDFSSVASELSGYDACFFCLGITAVGMTEPEYLRVTYDITMAATRVLIEQNPAMTFIYVSGASTDSTEQGRTMWARVKGKTENALLRLPFKATYMFRPGFIQPKHGVRSKTAWYNTVYTIVGPLYPVLKTLFPAYVTTTEHVGRAMIYVAKYGAPTSILGNREINAMSQASQKTS